MNSATEVINSLSDPSLFISEAFVAGEWLQTDSTFEVIEPVTGQPFSKVTNLTQEHIKKAIERAASGQKAFATTYTATQRSQLLRVWFELIVTHEKDLATILCLENGKTYAEAISEIKYAGNFVAWFAEEAKRAYGDTIPSSQPHTTVLTLKEPIGVCGIITPWNFPAAMITRKVAPALAAGCSVVIKPPSETPHTALALAKLAVKAGIPADCLQVCPTRDRTAATELATNPLISKLSFTGSTVVGKMLAGLAAGTLKKCSLELGGNAPFIVFDDADLALAVAGAMTSKFRCSGQTCVCVNRFLVQQGVSKDFTSKLVEQVRTLRMGPSFDPSTTQGPLINKAAVIKAADLVEDAKSKGAEVLIGGRPQRGDGFYFEPTVISRVTCDMKIAHEEIFGPVATIMEFQTEEEAVEISNASPFGLAGYVYSKSVSRLLRVAQHVECGMLGANTGMISAAEAPFGGVKESGYGREGSKYGLDEYLVVKSITIGNLDK